MFRARRGGPLLAGMRCGAVAVAPNSRRDGSVSGRGRRVCDSRGSRCREANTDFMSVTNPFAEHGNLDAFVEAWVRDHPLVPAEVDCALAVMLKILDGKCKMKSAEKTVMAALYRQVRHAPGQRLPADLRALVERAHMEPDAELQEIIYEKRVLAETIISRPVMKCFKARIRNDGLFAHLSREVERE